MSVPGAGRKIQSELMGWEGIAVEPHRFGGVEFMLGNREIGHIHGDALVDVPLPRPVRDELVAMHRAQPHHVLPRSGWVSIPLHGPDDVERAIQVLRQSYEIARQQRERRMSREVVATGSAGVQRMEN